MPKNKPGAPVTTESNKPFADEHTDKRIHEHLMNENDEISEEDIRNIRTDVDIKYKIPSKNTDTSESSTDNNDLEKESVKDNSDPEIDTSWNILES